MVEDTFSPDEINAIMEDVKMKNILVLVGSNNDIDKKGVPTKFVDDLEATVEKLNSENPNEQIDFKLDSCSADRTPQLLADIMNRQKVDGIIYSGGYSLVLGAAIQESLAALRRERTYNEGTTGTAEFFKDGRMGMMPIPGELSEHLRPASRYYKDDSYIPTIGVPGKDTPSQGVTALTSITENPSGCEPRPAVGLNRIDSAVNAMHKMMYGMEGGGFELVSVVYEHGQEEGAKKVEDRLKNLGFLRTSVASSSDVTFKNFKQRDDELVVYVGKNYVPSVDQKTELALVDDKVNFMINCTAKQDMSGKWKPYLDALTQLNNTVTVGVGNYDNAAVLAAELLNKPEVTAKMWEYRNGKTRSGVIDKPSWLQDGKVRRE